MHVASDIDCEQKLTGTLFYRYSPSVRADIGRYACFHGLAAAARYFSRKLGHRVSETTVHLIKKAYLEGKKEKRAAEDDGDVTVLPPKKHGKPVLLGEDLDRKVQLYLKKVREGGGVVSARIAMAAARGILLSYDRIQLAEFGGHAELNRHWAYSLLSRMKFVKRKVTTAKSKHLIAGFAQLKEAFLDDVVATVQMEEIPPELILNWDQTGIKIVPSNTWTMDKQGSKRVEVVGVDDKRFITAVFCGSLVGDFLPVQVIYRGKTPRCHPRYKFPSDWDITRSPKHWSNEETMIQYVENIIIPYVRCTRGGFEDDTLTLVIMDNFKGQITTSVTELLETNNIHVCLLPPNTTDLLQPMDVSVNKPAKNFLKRRFEDWYSQQLAKQFEGRDVVSTDLQPISLGLPVLKELGAKWMVEMAEYFAENPQIIVNECVQAGIAGALDGHQDNEQESDEEYETESDFEDSDVIEITVED